MTSPFLPLWALACALFSGGVLAQPATAVVRTEQVRAELMAHAPEGVAPGKPLWLGLQIQHAKDWHTYWKNPGDSGLPTTLEWKLPAGVKAGDIQWPTPKKFPIGHLANYGYEGTLLLPVPLTVAPGFQGRELEVQLDAAWLVCRKECIPEEGEFTLKLPVQVNDPAVAHVSRLDLGRDQTFTFDEAVFAGLMPGTGRATMAIGPIARLNAPGLLAALDRYPYGCSEQTVSRALPLLYLSELGVDPKDIDGELKRKINREKEGHGRRLRPELKMPTFTPAAMKKLIDKRNVKTRPI